MQFFIADKTLVVPNIILQKTYLLDIMVDNMPHWPLTLWNINDYKRNIKSIEGPCTYIYVRRKPKKIICLQLQKKVVVERWLQLVILHPQSTLFQRLAHSHTEIKSHCHDRSQSQPHNISIDKHRWTLSDWCKWTLGFKTHQTTKQIYQYNIIQNT